MFTAHDHSLVGTVMPMAYAALLPTNDAYLDSKGAATLAEALRGTWTLSMAAAAAGVSEQQVVAAVLQHHTRCGTAVVCQRYAKAAFT